MAITIDRDRVRLKIGDTDSDEPLLFDDEVDVFVAEWPDDLDIASAAAAEAIAAKFARGFDFSTDGQSFNVSERVAHYLALADGLDPTNSRSGTNSIVIHATTRVDGYSDDIPYDETEATSGTGRVRAGYWDPDLPS